MTTRLKITCLCTLVIASSAGVVFGQLQPDDDPQSPNRNPAPQRVINADFNQAADRVVRDSGARPAIPLARPSDEKSPSKPSKASGLWPFVALLGVVLLIVGLAKLMNRKEAALSGVLAETVFDILARRAIDARNSILLVRVGDKLVVVGLAQNGMTTLSEITDQIEVERLTNLSKASEAHAGFNWFGWLGSAKSVTSSTDEQSQRESLESEQSPHNRASRPAATNTQLGQQIPSGLSVRELEEGGHVS
jgi:flagellar biogenesis protein FliO